MALLTANFYSNALGTVTAITVILPEQRGVTKPHQALYLLAGGYADHTYMLREFPIERYVRDYDLAVVMPYMAGRCHYKNIPYGEQWRDFYSEELPGICRRMFHISGSREDTFAVGASGGGLLAARLGLQNPDTFSAVGSVYPALSSQRFLDRMADKSSERYKQLAYYYGDPMDPEYDIFIILEKAAANKRKAALHLSCGTEDGLFGIVTEFRDKAVELGFDPAWYQGPGGHTSEFFADRFVEILEWLPLRKLDK